MTTGCPWKLEAEPERCAVKRAVEFRNHDPVADPWKTIACSNCKPGAEHAAKAPPVPEEEVRGAYLRRAGGYKGPPCPDCGKPRPARENVKAERPCLPCWRTRPEYAEERRRYNQESHRLRKAGTSRMGRRKEEGDAR